MQDLVWLLNRLVMIKVYLYRRICLSLYALTRLMIDLWISSRATQRLADGFWKALSTWIGGVLINSPSTTDSSGSKESLDLVNQHWQSLHSWKSKNPCEIPCFSLFSSTRGVLLLRRILLDCTDLCLYNYLKSVQPVKGLGTLQAGIIDHQTANSTRTAKCLSKY